MLAASNEHFLAVDGFAFDGFEADGDRVVVGVVHEGKLTAQPLIERVSVRRCWNRL
jgi:hypothetical protein